MSVIIDKQNEQTWDALVSSDPRGHLLQTWAWGELKAAFGWRAHRVCVEQDGATVAGAQVLVRKVGPVSMAYIPKGPVLISQEEEHLVALWRGIHQLCRRNLALYCKVEPDIVEGGDMPLPWPSSPRWVASPRTVQPRRTIIVDLTDDDDAILARMKSKWRYNIRLSGRKGVEIREGTPDDVATFHTLMTTTGQRDAFGIHSAAYYKRALELCQPLGRARLLLAYHDDEPLAGLMAFAYNGASWYMYGASASHHRSLMPNHGLQWAAMTWAKSVGCTAYDLWGITDEGQGQDAPLAGVERFKRGFGGEVVRYIGAFDHVYSRPLYALAQHYLANRGND